MSHIFSFLPMYLAQMHVTHIAVWVGVLNAITFLIGLPFVPLWGVWAARFGGKSIIIRSAWVEMIVLGVMAATHVFGGVIFAMCLIGFQLGNSGIMLASIRRSAPEHKIGSAISIFSVSSPIGMAAGPLFGGLLVDHTSMNLHGLFWLDAALSLGTGLLLLLFYREPSVHAEASGASDGEEQPSGVWHAAWLSVRTTFTLRISLILFGLYTLLMIGRQMINPYIPMDIAGFHVSQAHLATTIGIWQGVAACIGAVITIVAGKLGDRVGFLHVLGYAFVLNMACTLVMAYVSSLIPFGLGLAGYSAATSICGAMVFALLSTRIPETHRVNALNLVYLPLYIGGMIGPALSSMIAGAFGLVTEFATAAVIFAGAALWAVMLVRRENIHANQGDGVHIQV